MQLALRGTRDLEHRSRVVWPLLALGFIVPVGALVGWSADIPFLYRYGSPYSFWPLAALGDAGVIGAQILLFRGQERWAQAVLVLPLLIASLSLVEYLSGQPIGLDQLFFEPTLRAMNVPSAGRISILSMLGMFASSGEALIARYSGRRLEIWVFALGALVMGFGCLSAGLHFAGFSGQTSVQPLRLSSALPAAITMVCMGWAPMAYRSAVDPDGLFGAGRPSAGVIKLGLLILLILQHELHL